MKEEILIAGGSGLVGANLTLKLRKLGVPFTSTRFNSNHPIFSENCVRYNFLEYEQCLAATEKKKSVVLCANISYGAKKNIENPTGSILPNLKIAAGLLEACAVNNVKTVIVISSTTLYQPAYYPIREDELDLNSSPYKAYLGVGWYNRYIEQLAGLYAETYGMRVIVFRPTSIYGPYDKFDDENSHIVPALIKRALNKENPFKVWGSPHVVRDFLYVEDFVDDILYALENDNIPASTPFNACNGKPLSIENAAISILKCCGHNGDIVFDQNKPSSIPYRAVDNKKYHCHFGVKARTSFKTGISKTVKWYKKLLTS